jgi:hypothetical protein
MLGRRAPLPRPLAHRPSLPLAHRPSVPLVHRPSVPPVHRPSVPPVHRPSVPLAHRPGLQFYLLFDLHVPTTKRKPRALRWRDAGGVAIVAETSKISRHRLAHTRHSHCSFLLLGLTPHIFIRHNTLSPISPLLGSHRRLDLLKSLLL